MQKGRHNFDTIRYDYYRDASVALEAFKAGQYDIRVENVAKNWAIGYDEPGAGGRPVQEEVASRTKCRKACRPSPSTRAGRCSRTRACARRWAICSISNGPTRICSTAPIRAPRAISPIPISPSSGLPSADELKILEPIKGEIPADGLHQGVRSRRRPTAPATSATICARRSALLKEAGWTVKDGKLVNDKGEPIRLRVPAASRPSSSASCCRSAQNLRRIGIAMNLRTVDPAQYENRLQQLRFRHDGDRGSANRCRRATSSATIGPLRPPTSRAAQQRHRASRARRSTARRPDHRSAGPRGTC